MGEHRGLGEEGVLFWAALTPSLSPSRVCSGPPPSAHSLPVPSVHRLLLHFWLTSCILSDLAISLFGVLPLGILACLPKPPPSLFKEAIPEKHHHLQIIINIDNLSSVLLSARRHTRCSMHTGSAHKKHTWSLFRCDGCLKKPSPREVA